ncbi:MAG: cysteine desulfurase [Candidatus Omnitrophica bacterium]|nr:cysteine desulfurase [Candidatus Omnitrophota bacterium]
MLEERVYLDYQNQAMIRPQVKEAIRESAELTGNPSSMHQEGRRTAQAVERARNQVAALLGASPQEILFTSSGTEANLAAITGLLKAVPAGQGKHLVVSAVEHLSVLQSVRRLEKEGFSVTVLPVDSRGCVDPGQCEKALTPQTVLVSVQWANPEVGTVQPVRELALRVKSKGILFHSDAVAACGCLPVDVREVPVDALSIAANTFGGPSGVGALYLRKGVRLFPLFVGGTQQEGRRAGSENVLGIAGMGVAAELAKAELNDLPGRLIPLRDRLIGGILKGIPETRLNGHPTARLPGHASFSFSGVNAEELVFALDLKGVAVGLGSACSAQTIKASHVLKAMGVEDSLALGTILCTLGWATRADQVDRAADLLRQVVMKNRLVAVEGKR